MTMAHITPTQAKLSFFLMEKIVHAREQTHPITTPINRGPSTPPPTQSLSFGDDIPIARPPAPAITGDRSDPTHHLVAAGVFVIPPVVTTEPSAGERGVGVSVSRVRSSGDSFIQS